MGNQGKELKHKKGREYPISKPPRMEFKAMNKGSRPVRKMKKTNW